MSGLNTFVTTQFIPTTHDASGILVGWNQVGKAWYVSVDTYPDVQIVSEKWRRHRMLDTPEDPTKSED